MLPERPRALLAQALQPTSCPELKEWPAATCEVTCSRSQPLPAPDRSPRYQLRVLPRERLSLCSPAPPQPATGVENSPSSGQGCEPVPGPSCGAAELIGNPAVGLNAALVSGLVNSLLTTQPSIDSR